MLRMYDAIFQSILHLKSFLCKAATCHLSPPTAETWEKIQGRTAVRYLNEYVGTLKAMWNALLLWFLIQFSPPNFAIRCGDSNQWPSSQSYSHSLWIAADQFNNNTEDRLRMNIRQQTPSWIVHQHTPYNERSPIISTHKKTMDLTQIYLRYQDVKQWDLMCFWGLTSEFLGWVVEVAGVWLYHTSVIHKPGDRAITIQSITQDTDWLSIKLH